MVGIIIVSHGDLAKALLDSAAMLVGSGEQIKHVAIHPGDSPEEFNDELEKAVGEVDTGDGVVALVDLYGGTPNNNMARIGYQRNVRIVTGVNLPMTMYAIIERTEDSTAEELVEGMLSVGTDGIKEFTIPGS